MRLTVKAKDVREGDRLVTTLGSMQELVLGPVHEVIPSRAAGRVVIRYGWGKAPSGSSGRGAEESVTIERKEDANGRLDLGNGRYLVNGH